MGKRTPTMPRLLSLGLKPTTPQGLEVVDNSHKNSERVDTKSRNLAQTKDGVASWVFNLMRTVLANESRSMQTMQIFIGSSSMVCALHIHHGRVGEYQNEHAWKGFQAGRRNL
mmetsp:Transcript_9280/g.25682  ORF Transcript_9280/g.25682 Transcript_9280/m.25682 type:complete len:113 (+) Transcript_9280:725-1063(+)